MTWKTQQVSIHQNLLKKADLASLKSENDKLDIDELETIPVDLSKLSNVENMKLLKRTGWKWTK